MKIAIVGCGGMGHIHAAAYARMTHVRIVGVCDVDPIRAAELGERIGAPSYTDYGQLLAAEAPELVSLTVPSHLHLAYIEQTAAHGAHIVCEKPLALTVADAEAALAVCAKHGVRLFVGHVVRFFPDYAGLKHAVDGGRIGTPGVAHLRRVGGYPERQWFAEEAKSGGVITDLMIHDIDYARWTLGPVRSVYCLRRTAAGLDYALATLVFASGAVANLESHWGYPGSFRTAAEFAGDGGVVRLDSAASAALHMRKTPPKRTDACARTGEGPAPAAADAAPAPAAAEIPRSPLRKSPYARELEHFVDCLRLGGAPLVTATDALQALRVAEAAHQSARTGRAVYLSSEEGERL
ncbi:Gfo/Idh/MocA family oxidoreductase [Paenibacillus sp. IB182496]|uniref:Gfo/Idh/MocA family oxidoreductase n=1 Tax=Paenibacillus sabuli TaxID=2772509 RepID=A0A927BYX8_9BACL|nr:Gfo/Idh/MocA family oxidoreductase [Paenibacillus sabuli]MBD2847868.1 Gfo/Idh/MocA family oxidoreductase [Paenibacillus sabuli]